MQKYIQERKKIFQILWPSTLIPPNFLLGLRLRLRLMSVQGRKAELYIHIYSTCDNKEILSRQPLIHMIIGLSTAQCQSKSSISPFDFVQSTFWPLKVKIIENTQDPSKTSTTLFLCIDIKEQLICQPASTKLNQYAQSRKQDNFELPSFFISSF